MKPTLTPRSNDWIVYTDASGTHGAAPDWYLVAPTEVVCVEIKRTGCEVAHDQLRNLYGPLLAHIYSRPVRGLQVCQNTAPTTPGPFVYDINDFIFNTNLKLATMMWRE